MQLNRRRLLKLAAAAILVATGCTGNRRTSDLDSAMVELNQLLAGLDEADQHKVTAIAQRIQVRARELADEHRGFTDSFDRQLSTYDATEAQLKKLVDDYNRRRLLKRNDLLHLQDELHAAMTPDDWSGVVRVLNRAGKSLAAYTLQSI
jgi:hypothetical protein